MAIYGRFGGECRTVRKAVLEDVKLFDRRRPDKVDRDAIASASYWIIEFTEPGMERFQQLAHLAYLRADGGGREISEACEALAPAPAAH